MKIIFCAKDIPAQQIIDYMSELSDPQLEFKIAPPESMSIIGSKSINTTGDVFIIDLNSITKIHNKRSKRFLDIISSSCCLSGHLRLCFFNEKTSRTVKKYYSMCWLPLKSWVGYRYTDYTETHKLPKIKKGVLNPTDQLENGRYTH